MDTSPNRMTQPDAPPGIAEITEWMGSDAYDYWKRITQLIDEMYPGVFAPEWLFGGRKHGWSLRYKKSKSFCTLIPERNRFSLLIVFGRKEREEVEAIRDSLSQNSWEVYDAAPTYHDGKWVLFTVNSDMVVDDVRQLLAVKRKPGRQRRT